MSKKPIDLFIEFGKYCTTLRRPHSNHFFHMINAYGICKTGSAICQGNYTEPLAKAFPADEKIALSIEAVMLASKYWEKHKAMLATAQALIEQAEGHDTDTERGAARRKTGDQFFNDRELQHVVSDIKRLSGGVITHFKMIKVALYAADKHHPLLQPMAQ